MRTLDLAKFQIIMRTLKLMRLSRIVFKITRTIVMMMATRRF